MEVPGLRRVGKNVENLGNRKQNLQEELDRKMKEAQEMDRREEEERARREREINEKIEELEEIVREEQENEKRRRDEMCEEDKKVVVIGDSLMVGFKRFLQDNSREFLFLNDTNIRYLRGGWLEEILEEAKKVKFGDEGGILVIQGGGNSLKEEGAVFQWMRIVDTIQEVWKKIKM